MTMRIGGMRSRQVLFILHLSSFSFPEVPLQSSISNVKATDQLKVLVFGAGAIGTYYGGSLALAGHHVVFVEQPKMVEQLRERGLRLDLTIDERRKTKDAFVVEPRSFVIEPSLE